MRLHPHIIVTALLAAVTLAYGAGPAAAETKPITKDGPKLAASDAATSAAAARIDAEGTALGSYWDPDRAQLVVVVGPDSDIGEDEAARLVDGPYRLEELPIAKQTADSIREEIAARDFGPEAASFSYASHLDLQTGRVVLETDAPSSVIARLLKEHREIQLQRSRPAQDAFNRADDIPSFWGGASINNGVATCSTGFAVHSPSGARFMTTASHCFGVGSTVRTPSGTFVGNVVQRGGLGSAFFWDNRDVELIGGSSYSARVYTGGAFSATSKPVVGAGDPVTGVTGYCSSGQTSGEQCNLTVQSTGAIVCTQSGCLWPVIQYSGGPARFGDSGGSFYIPNSVGQVFARGEVVATNFSSSWAEPWSRISSSMGVSIG
jgi:hypothetical protein